MVFASRLPMSLSGFPDSLWNSWSFGPSEIASSGLKLWPYRIVHESPVSDVSDAVAGLHSAFLRGS